MRTWMESRFVCLLVVSVLLAMGGEVVARPTYRSAFDLALDAAHRTAYVSDSSAARLVVVDLENARVEREVELRGKPAGVLLDPSRGVVYVAEDHAGSVAEVPVDGHTVRRRFEVGPRPLDIALTGDRRHLVVTNSVGHDISSVSLESGREVDRLDLPREPFFLARVPGTNRCVIGNLLPVGAPGFESLETVVSVIEVDPQGALQHVARIPLPGGATSVRQIAVSADGHWAYVAHTVGRIHVPTTQLERGWISTNHLSVLDLREAKLHASLVLDRIDRGASDPWGLALSRDGSALWITLRGTDELVRLDLGRLHRLLEEGLDASEVGSPARVASTTLASESGAPYAGDGTTVWRRIAENSTYRRELTDDLRALSSLGLAPRFAAGVRGPLGVALDESAGEVVVVGRFSGDVAVLDARSGSILRRIPLGTQPPADAVRRGELLFHDATISLQSWLSCSTCHPDDGRNDGLRWDLPNDGLGTPQMTRSLVKSYRFAPTTARGARPSFEASVEAGFRFLHTAPDPERVEDMKAFLESLEPEPSPFLQADGELTPSQKRGRAIFEGRKAGCTRCHKGDIRSDFKPHDVGTAGEDAIGGSEFYTPKLFELYRTAPFLHDGRAATLREIFRKWNEAEQHGGGHRLGDDELDDLIAYLLTL